MGRAQINYIYDSIPIEEIEAFDGIEGIRKIRVPILRERNKRKPSYFQTVVAKERTERLDVTRVGEVDLEGKGPGRAKGRPRVYSQTILQKVLDLKFNENRTYQEIGIMLGIKSLGYLRQVAGAEIKRLKKLGILNVEPSSDLLNKEK